MTLLALATVWVVGVLIGTRFDLLAPALGLFAGASALLLALSLSLRRSPMPALLLLVLLMGMLRAELFDGDRASALARYHSIRPLQVQGVVASDPEAAGSATRFRFSVEMVAPDGEGLPVSGDALVTLRESAELARQRDKPHFRYGDRLLLVGAMTSPPELEDFDYSAYLARQGIGSVMSFPQATLLGEGEGAAFYRWLYAWRNRIAEALARAVPEPQASLGQALLLGLRYNIPEDLVNDFRATGASHVLAISGLNVTILVGVGVAVSQAVFGRRRQLYLILPFVLLWLYALISGMSPSVARAAIMGSVYLAALFLGRPRSILPALGLAAAAMVAINPNVLWSVSFQLSFGAMAGIALTAEPMSLRIKGLYSGRSASSGPLSSVLAATWDTVGMTVAATLWTLPLIAFYFQQVSLVGLPVNLLALPALPAILVTQAVTGLLGLMSTWLAQPFGWLAWLSTAYLTGVVGMVAKIPGASVNTGALAPLLVWVYYATLFLFHAKTPLLRTMRRGTAVVSTLAPRVSLASAGVSRLVLAAAVSLAALLWLAALSLPDHRLRIAVIDVGQGDGIFLGTPSGQQILVDGGPEPMDLVQFLGSNMPFRDRTIELVVLTHPHSDHVTGLIEVLRRYHVLRVLEAEMEMEYDSPPYQAWRRAVAAEGAQVTRAEPGQEIRVGDGVLMQVVSPPSRLLRGTSSDLNNASVVLRVVYGHVSFLLAGDMAREAEAVVLSSGLPIDSDVLKVGHHGSRSSSSSPFLGMVSPAVVVISVGADNPFGHPHPEVIEALRQRIPERLVFLTRDRGGVEFTTDGKRLRVKTQR